MSFYLTEHAAERPDQAAVVMAGSGEVVTYRQLDERSRQLAHLLAEQGLRPGDHVALFMENNPRFFEVYWAVVRSGMYLTTVNSYLTAPEAGYIIDNSRAQVLITSRKLADVATGLVDLTPNVTRRLMVDGTAPGYESYEEQLEGRPMPEDRNAPMGRTMLYSSGSTGRPKGIKIDLPNLPIEAGSEFARLLHRLYKIGPDDIYLNPTPLYHAAPLLYVSSIQTNGGTVVVMEKFDAAEALALIEKHRVTMTQFVPTMFIRMLKLPEAERKRDLSSLRIVVHGAAPCSVEVKQKMIDWMGPVLYEYYGATEDNGSTFITSEEWLSHIGSVGRVLPGAVAHICDDDGNELPPGETGTVYMESLEGVPNFEYFGEAGLADDTRHPSKPGWTTLGDVGWLDEEGYLYLTDRKAFMVISGGVNIYPQEIENLLGMHPKVADVAVFGVPHADLGEAVKAVVQPADPASAGPELAAELLEYANQNLARFKVPRTLDFMDELPRLPTGKLYKRKLRDPYWEGHAGKVV